MSSSKRKLKICHVITRMIVGGAQENTLFTIVGHIQEGHEVVLVTGPSPGPEGELLSNSDYPKFEIAEIPHLVREVSVSKDIKAYRELKKFFKERKFDVVHTHSSKAGVLGRAAAWDCKVPLVVHTVHGQAFHPYESSWKNLLYINAERWAAKRCHKIYAVAQAMIDQCVECKVAPREKYQVVYSGMEIGKFLNSKPEADLRVQLGIPEGVRVVGAVARLFPLKGYEYFIPAAQAIAEKHDDVHFLIVGNGSMYEEMQAQIAEIGLTDRFHFAGLVPPDEVYRYIALMDLLMHLSLREGLPRSVVQALASGKPAIGFRLDGTPEVVLDGSTGYCAEPQSVESVVKFALKILESPELAAKMGENGKKLVAEKFDWHKMSSILEEDYLKMLSVLGK
ncbi:MAG: glycosyltransferase family 4 protein [Lentisphaerae bacterium]|nr:glycosyltransferase family 4 protein [Lentisphaerota bacterium]MCP4100306.1 glycosyltransferase family 4 protein [Lentisphaerota bacterium]